MGRRWLDCGRGRAFGLEDSPSFCAALAKGDCTGAVAPKARFCFDGRRGAPVADPLAGGGGRLRMRTVSYRGDWAGLRLRLSEDY